jgi:hypothetical protein
MKCGLVLVRFITGRVRAAHGREITEGADSQEACRTAETLAPTYVKAVFNSRCGMFSALNFEPLRKGATPNYASDVGSEWDAAC